MGKLADMVAEDLSFAEKIKINVRKVGLAGVGLASLMEAERNRLYRQVLDMGEAYGGDDTLVGRLSVLGTGTVNLLWEESQRVFDELVEEGEQALGRKNVPVVAQSASQKVAQARPVAKPKATPVAKPAAPAAKTAAKPSKPAAKKAPAERLTAELKQRLEAAQAQQKELALDAQQALEAAALTAQVQEGDVKGRRPAKSKAKEQAAYDARHQLKGMKADEALNRLEALLQRFSAETVH